MGVNETIETIDHHSIYDERRKEERVKDSPTESPTSLEGDSRAATESPTPLVGDSRAATESSTPLEDDSRAPTESTTPLEGDSSCTIRSSQRLLLYSDAVISITATVMILPVAHTKLEDDEELPENLQLLLTSKIAVYLMSFLIVSVSWAAHTRLFQVIAHVDDSLALLNLACMMLITFMPYTFSLMVAFPHNILGINLFCACVIVTGLIQAVIVVYGFSRPFLLIDDIQISGEQMFHKKNILKVILRVPLLCLIATIFSFIFFPLSYLVLAFVIFIPYFSHPLKWCFSKAVDKLVKPPSDLVGSYFYHPSEPLSKERVEAFTDGVYAIVATLLILDICENNVPGPSEVAGRFDSSLTEALQEHGPQFLAYFGSFATVGLLWFVHHSLFLHVTKITRIMGLLNTLSLAFIGGLPLAYQLTHALPQSSLNEPQAVRISCTIIFFAGFFQLATWVAALLSEGGTLHCHVHYGGREHAFMFAKLMVYPCVALGTFSLTCVLGKLSAPIFHLMEVAVPLAFLLLRYTLQTALVLLWLLKSACTRKRKSNRKAPPSCHSVAVTM